MNDLRQFTVFAIIALALFIGVLDIAFSHFGGNKSTISRVVLDGQGQNPAIAFLMCYSFSGLMTHLFWPTAAEFPTVLTTVWKSLLFMAPIFYLAFALSRVEFGQSAQARAFMGFENVTLRLPWAQGTPIVVEMLVGALSGLLLAKWLIPQHVAPGIV